MDKDFDSLNIEFDFENYKKIDNETIRFYAKKAFVTLFNDKTKISKNLEKCLIDFYGFALDVLGKDFIYTEIPYIQKKANDGITEYKKLIVDYKNKQVFEMKIEELGLSTQTYSLLRRANFHTIGDVISKSKSKFLTIKRFENGRLKEVIEALNKYNLTLPD